MFERSWRLTKLCASVLKNNPQLILFPLISSVATVMVIVLLVLPIFGVGAFGGATEEESSSASLATLFLLYVSLYSVIIFFNVALVAAAMIHLDGDSPSVKAGIQVAMSKFASILGYAIIAATVGVVLFLIRDRRSFIWRLIAAGLDAGWTVATYLVVPALVSRDIGPIDAIKESASLIKKTWGESFVGQTGVGLVFFLVYVLIVLCSIVLWAITPSIGNGWLTGWIITVAIAAVVIAMLAQSALTGIYSAALYRFAKTGSSSIGFDVDVLKAAFETKN
ncbi:MAG: DUF6159 family protein [Proteobacteria bacterium]|nr:DUF6159 family protein [Pseudomonadota bacterium]